MSEIVKRDNEAIIRPGQDLVQPATQGFRMELHSLLEEGTKGLVIDLINVEIVDSVGIGILIATSNSLSKLGGKLTVVNASEELYKLFTMMRLDQHFEVRRV